MTQVLKKNKLSRFQRKIVNFYLQCPLNRAKYSSVIARKVSIFVRCPNYPGVQIKETKANVK